MTLLPIIRTVRGIEIELAGTEKASKSYGIYGLFLLMALQEKLFRSTVKLCFPQTLQAGFFEE